MGGVKYRLKEPGGVDWGDGRPAVFFEAGDHAPADEAEAEALEHLVENVPQVASRVKAPKEA